MDPLLYKITYQIYDYDWGMKDGISLFFNNSIKNRVEAEFIIPNPLKIEYQDNKVYNCKLNYNVKLLGIGKNLSIQVHPKKTIGILHKKNEYLYAFNNMSIFLGCLDDDHIKNFYNKIHVRHINKFLEFQKVLSLYLKGHIAEITANLENIDLKKFSDDLLELLYSGLYQNYFHIEDPVYYSKLISICESYINDQGILLLPFLKYLKLKSGECVYVPSGVIHSYFSGVGLEIAELSNDTIRYGLTNKTIERKLFLDNLIEVEEEEVKRFFINKQVKGNLKIYDLQITQMIIISMDREDSIDFTEKNETILICKSGELKVNNKAQTIYMQSGESCIFRGYTSIRGIKNSVGIIIGRFQP